MGPMEIVSFIRLALYRTHKKESVLALLGLLGFVSYNLYKGRSVLTTEGSTFDDILRLDISPWFKSFPS